MSDKPEGSQEGTAQQAKKAGPAGLDHCLKLRASALSRFGGFRA